MRLQSPNPDSRLEAGVSIAEQADRVVRLSASAWNVARVSPRAIARQAPRGYVPRRVLRRLHASAATLGRPLLVFVEITLAQKSEQIFKKVRDELQNVPEVLECHLISGSFDYLVKARLAGMSEYRSLLGSILQQMPVPAQSNSYVVMEEVKESFVITVHRGKA